MEKRMRLSHHPAHHPAHHLAHRLAWSLLLIAICLASFPSARQAQQPAPPKPQDPSSQDVVRINTQLVQLDVVVTDKKGRHVEDLREADFELLVDGKKQSLTHFTHITLPNAVPREIAKKKAPDAEAAPASMPTRQIEASEVRRTIAFVVDDLGLGFASTERVRETMRKYVAEQMQEGDLVAILRTGGGLGMLESFTSDKRLLFSAIERLQWNPLSRDMNPGFDDSSAELTEDQSEQQAMAAMLESFRTTTFTTGTLGAIAFVVQSLRTLPGRKSVILLSDGFKLINQDDDTQTNQILQAMQNLVEMANRSSVVVYAMDAKGLQPFTPGADVGGRPSAQSYTDALNDAQAALEGPVFLAKQTGGFVVTNTNDLNIGVQEAIYDQQSYYLLGFDPDDEKFDQKFHRFQVKSLRPGLSVRTRSGFLGYTEEEMRKEPATRGEQLLAALQSPLGKRDLDLRMTPYFFNSAKGGPLVRTLFHVDPAKLKFKDGDNGRKQLHLELAAFAFDETGAAADASVHRINLDFDAEQYRKVMTNGLGYTRDFKLKKPGAYQFRAVLRDGESGVTGTASQFMRVPDLRQKRLAISGLVLSTPREAGAGGDSVLPASPYVRQFPQTGWIQYGVGIYNATTDKKTNQPTITVQAEVYRDGKRAHQFPTRTVHLPPGADPKHFDYVGRLQLNQFRAGAYLLRLVVTDGLARKRDALADQWMDFSIK
jgi:VWFA-related protein